MNAPSRRMVSLAVSALLAVAALVVIVAVVIGFYYPEGSSPASLGVASAFPDAGTRDHSWRDLSAAAVAVLLVGSLFQLPELLLDRAPRRKDNPR